MRGNAGGILREEIDPLFTWQFERTATQEEWQVLCEEVGHIVLQRWGLRNIVGVSSRLKYLGSVRSLATCSLRRGNAM